MRGSKGRNAAQRRSWPAIAGGAVGVAAIVAIAISAVPRPEPAAAPADPATIAEGSTLYLRSCAACHGVDLLGTDAGPPFLDVIYAPNHHGDEAFQQAVIAGVVPHHWNFGTMAPIEGLTREDVAKIVAFVRSEQRAAGIVRDPSHP